MNALSSRFPTAVRIEDNAVPINTDFRTVLKIQSAFNDAELTESEKIEVMIKLIYPSPPSNLVTAVKQAIKFINIGEDISPSDEPSVYSFEKDSRYIYSAFQSSYSIDLENIEYMHWWKFRALFSDLGDCFFSQLIGMRNRMRTGELLESEKKFVQENMELVALEDKGASEADEFFKNWGDLNG